MGFHRVKAKQEAKQSIMRAVPSPIMVTLVFLLLTSGISACVGLSVADPFQELFEYVYVWGYELEDALWYVMEENQGTIPVYFLAFLLLALFCSIMEVGYLSYTMRVARGEPASYSNLFDGFRRLGQTLWMNILIDIFTFLWGLLGAVPGLAVLALGVWMEDLLMIMGSTAVFVIGFLVTGIFAALRYALVPFFFLDDPKCTAGQAVRLSKEAMRGRKMEYALLILSFFGWFLLVGFIQTAAEGMALGLDLPDWVSMALGRIPMLWLSPYVSCTQVNFFDALTGYSHGQPSCVEGYNSNYRYPGGPSGPEPF